MCVLVLSSPTRRNQSHVSSDRRIPWEKYSQTKCCSFIVGNRPGGRERGWWFSLTVAGTFVILKAKTLNRSAKESLTTFTAITTEVYSCERNRRWWWWLMIMFWKSSVPVLMSPHTLHNRLGTPIPDSWRFDWFACCICEDVTRGMGTIERRWIEGWLAFKDRWPTDGASSCKSRFNVGKWLSNEKEDEDRSMSGVSWRRTTKTVVPLLPFVQSTDCTLLGHRWNHESFFSCHNDILLE